MLGRLAKIAVVLMPLALAAAAQTIPAGTRLTVRVGSEISSGTAKTGDRFDATLAHALVVHGKTLAKVGAPVRGKVTSAKSSGRLHAPGELTLRLTSVRVNGQDGSHLHHVPFRQRQGSYQEQCHKDWRRRGRRRTDWRAGRWRKGGCDRSRRRCRGRNRRRGGHRKGRGCNSGGSGFDLHHAMTGSARSAVPMGGRDAHPTAGETPALLGPAGRARRPPLRGFALVTLRL